MLTQALKITQIPSDLLADANFVPRALLLRPIGYFIGQGYRFEAGTDDLDDYKSAFFELEGGVRFGLISYRGNPQDSITLYFDENVGDTRELVKRVLSAFKLPPNAVDGTEIEDAPSPRC
jgi:hypothetical protein